MPIYRVLNADFGERHLREWRRGVRNTIALLLVALGVCAAGLLALDNTAATPSEKLFRAAWNAANLITTLGDFTEFDWRQKLFMMGTMFFFLVIGGYAVSRLTGILSSAAVIELRENRAMARALDQLNQHVIVIGFGSLGELVADRLRHGGDAVVVVERVEALATRASGLGYPVVLGDAGADDHVFDRAGVARARALVVTTEDPDRKIAITVQAHARNPALRIAATGANRERGALLQHAGASEVVVADDLIAGALIGRLAKKSGG
jgi:voltage-gated potassium channel Kch